MRHHQLKEVQLEVHYPTLTPQQLGFLELEQDECFPYLKPEQIVFYIEQAIAYGQDIAKQYAQHHSLKDNINQMLKQNVKIRLLSKPIDHQIARAQYLRKEKTIVIYQSSLEEIRKFFHELLTPISQEELIALHLYHEWFHHLEETTIPPTDRFLPKVKVKTWGPLVWKKALYRTREIAAHAFTQTALQLSWYPSLLDHYLSAQASGISKLELREQFQDIRKRYEAFTHPHAADPH